MERRKEKRNRASLHRFYCWEQDTCPNRHTGRRHGTDLLLCRQIAEALSDLYTRRWELQNGLALPAVSDMPQQLLSDNPASKVHPLPHRNTHSGHPDGLYICTP